ncbi:hydroxycinnamoyltransferase [Cannabis sativa]|uniref:hydroxycinnamoyltransferase n=1 Tax=Cannabis sativa TaxID=3483 RepID=UPI0029CA0B12|nr:hydroxycinnamoyltransferase [Cannabis sativa]
MAVSKSRVSVHSTLTAVSSRPVGSGNKTHKFTSLDHAMGLHSLHIVFYYRDNVLKDFDLDPARVSLSDALSLYPQVTGRIARNGDGNWEVKNNDAGVRVVKAQVGASFDEWLRSADGMEEKDLMVWDEMPKDPTNWSPFRIQINEFEGGGVAVGLSCTHMHADPTSATLLFKSWIDTHRGRAIAHPLVNSGSDLCTRPDTNPKKNSVTYYHAKSIARAAPLVKMATATFKFSNAILKQCLSGISESCQNATPFDYLGALFWTRVAQLKVLKNISTYSLSICTDFRKLLKKTPLPLGYYGNALHFSMLSLQVRELSSGSDLGHVVRELHHHVASVDDDEVRSAIDWLESRRKREGEEENSYGPAFRMYGPELTCVKVDHLGSSCGPNGSVVGPLMYDTAFDEGAEPVHVSYHIGNVEGEGLIMVMPSSEGGLGRVVTVTLPENELAALCEDQALLGLQPIMLLNGGRGRC